MEWGDALIKITTTSSFEGERVLMLVRDWNGEHGCKYYILNDETKYTGYMSRGPQVDKIEISEAIFQEILNELEKTQIGICPDEVLGLDGSTTTIEIMRGMNTMRLSCWCGCPDSWKNLDKIIDLLHEHLWKGIKEAASAECGDDEL